MKPSLATLTIIPLTFPHHTALDPWNTISFSENLRNFLEIDQNIKLTHTGSGNLIWIHRQTRPTTPQKKYTRLLFHPLPRSKIHPPYPTIMQIEIGFTPTKTIETHPSRTHSQ
ncbi:hypothetical protein GDO81_003593 [Engystomops pustulosus]|uniref:Uncharacterized protein n=1 Tax=Engystomops pustulosus TaxID=76066 RepID=A0AAV7A274_ENGPU|nr:hypothetical protein GDO81_003593 [Engystomops pustulosus]